MYAWSQTSSDKVSFFFLPSPLISRAQNQDYQKLHKTPFRFPSSFISFMRPTFSLFKAQAICLFFHPFQFIYVKGQTRGLYFLNICHTLFMDGGVPSVCVLSRVAPCSRKKQQNSGFMFPFFSFFLGGVFCPFSGFPSSTLTVVGSFRENGQVLD